MREQIKIVLLGIIAVSLVVQIIFQMTDSDSGGTRSVTPDPTAINQPGAQNIQPQSLNALNPGDDIPPRPDQLEQPTPPNPTTADWSNEVSDIGKVSAGDKVKHTFNVTNTGPNTLNFMQVKGDNGLTIVSFPTDGIEPGGSGTIVVEWNTVGESGVVNKTVHVTANVTPAHKHLTLSGTIQ
ncbi:MAG: DUF1573 domain-containing protein [Bacteroidetes bacterium]|nr:DUF1573 domain-containing protein [Bacteroidota bacterium]